MRRACAAALAGVLALTGCAAIPDDGPVREGSAEVLPVQPFEPILEGPEPAAGPEAIVTGFLNASAAGVATDFTVAQEFLTPAAAAAWDPISSVLVYDSGTDIPTWDAGEGIVSYEVPLASTLDANGRRVDADSVEAVPLEYSLVKNDSGEWRIDALPNGVVVSRANFSRFFRPVELFFASADLSTAVPELRWLPGANSATAAARELVAGPSTWLADAVVTGFPAMAALAVESVVVTDGMATVDLTSQSAGTPEERELAWEQMRLTLTKLPGVRDVDVRIGGLPLAEDTTLRLANSPVPGPEAAVLVDGRLGVWDGERLQVTEPEAGLMPSDASNLALSYDGLVAAVARPGVGIQTTDALATSTLVDPGEDDEPTGTLELTTLVAGADLVSPSFDTHGFVWTAERTGAQGLVVAHEDHDPLLIGTSWLPGRTVQSLAVSKEGARVVVMSKAGGQPVLEVAAIVRDGAGVPVGLGEPVAIGAGVGAGTDVTWIDPLTVAALGEPVDGASSPLWIVGVGGGTDMMATMRDAAAVSAVSGTASLVVVSEDGRVEERYGTSWTGVLDGVSDLTHAG